MAFEDTQQGLTQGVTGVVPESQDLPLISNDVLIEEQLDLPIETVEIPPEENPVVTKAGAAFAAALETDVKGTETISAYRRLSAEAQATAIAQELSNMKSRLDIESIREVTEEALFANPRALGALSDILIEQTKLADERARNVAANAIDALGKGDVAPAEATKAQADWWFLQQVAPLADAIGGWQVWKELGRDFLLPGTGFKDNFDLTGKFLGAEDVIIDMMFNFQKMELEDRMKIWPDIVANVTESFDFHSTLFDQKKRTVDTLMKFLDPQGSLDTEDFSVWWSTLDVVDNATVIASLVGAAAKIGRTTYLANLAAKAGDTQLAARSTADTLTVGPVEGRIDPSEDRLTALNNADPFRKDQDDAYIPDISTATQDVITEFRRKTEMLTESITTRNQMRESFLTDEGRVKQEADAMVRWSEAKMENIRVLEGEKIPKGATDIKAEVLGRPSGTTTTFKYSYVDPETGLIVDHNKAELTLTLNDSGFWTEVKDVRFSKFIGSPMFLARGSDITLDVQQATRLDTQSLVLEHRLSKLAKEAFKGMPRLGKKGKESRARISDALLTGDNKDEIWDASTLKTKFNLTEPEVGVYFKMRSIYDMMYDLRNFAKREEMQVHGLKGIDLPNRTQEVIDEAGIDIPNIMAGRVFEEFASASSSLRDRGIDSLYDADLHTYRSYSDTELKKMFDEQGYNLTRLNSSYDTGDFGKVSYALVRPQRVSELPQQVLAWKAAYVPREYPKGSWWVKEAFDDIVDGKVGTGRNTLRFFSTKKEADAWRITHLAGRTDGIDPKKIEVLGDREIEELGSIDGEMVSNSAGNGLYTGARTQESILYGKEGIDSEQMRLDAFEALGNNLSNISTMFPRNIARLGWEQRWINYANEILPFGTNVTEFKKIGDAQGVNSKAITKLNTWHNNIKMWQGFRTEGEAIFDGYVRDVYEWALGNKFLQGTRINNGLRTLANSNVVGGLKEFAFQANLGFYTIRQLFVQSFGAVVAATANSINPLRFGRLVVRDNAALLAAMTGRPNDKQLALIAKGTGINAGRLSELKDAYTRSGLNDAVQTNSDYEAVVRGFGTTGQFYNTLKDKGLLFYTAGERHNRRISFIEAFDDWKNVPGNKGKPVDDIAVRAMMDQANIYMLNMSKANKASLQRGILGVPTQFWQISFKSLEGMLNTQFTTAQKSRIVAGQVALLGGTGIGLDELGGQIIDMVYSPAEAAAVKEANPLLEKSLSEGFVGWTLMGLFNVEVDAARSFSLADGMNTLWDDMFSDQSIPAGMALGAFGNVADRVQSTFFREMSMWQVRGNDSAVLDLGLALSATAGSLLSSTNNLVKAYDMLLTNKLINKHGRVIKDNVSAWEAYFKGMGFASSAHRQLRNAEDMIRAKNEHRNETLNLIRSEKIRFMDMVSSEQLSIDSPEIKRWRNQEKFMYDKLGMEDRIWLERNLTRSLINPTPLLDKARKKLQKYSITKAESRFRDKIGGLDFHDDGE